jgi:hypothetical protein
MVLDYSNLPDGNTSSELLIDGTFQVDVEKTTIVGSRVVILPAAG